MVGWSVAGKAQSGLVCIGERLVRSEDVPIEESLVEIDGLYKGKPAVVGQSVMRKALRECLVCTWESKEGGDVSGETCWGG